MGKPSKAVEDFRAKYNIDSDEIWEVHGTTWVVKHKALERVAAEVGIAWEKPELKVCDMAAGLFVVLIGGRLGERVEYSFGEASPKNNKNAYGVAMAEKRAKDRVILKLLTVHGAIYSKAEMDADYDDDQRPRRDTLPDEYGEIEHGEDVITRDDNTQVLTVDAQRKIYAELAKEILTNETVEECKRWTITAKKRASRLSETWRKTLNDEYLKHLREIEKRDADEYIEMRAG